MPKVSILIPTYNVEQYLKQCLDSVVNQTLKDIEIICINDGSTDNSLSIIKKYAQNDNRIKIIDKKNSGYGDSMNKGLDAATGEYIGIVEPDDYVPLDMYETLYNKAEEQNVDLIKADFNRFIGEGETLELFYNKLDKTGSYYNKVINPQEDLKPFDFIMNTWSGIYKRDFIEKYHIRHNTTPGASFQDNGFWFQTFVLAERIYFLDTPFYMNRRDNPNSSVKDKGKVYLMKYEYDFIRKFLEEDSDRFTKYIGIYTHKKFQNYIFNYKRIDIKFKKEFLKIFRKEFKLAAKNNEIDYGWFNKNELKTLEQILKNPNKFYRKSNNLLSLAEKIFSIKNIGIHKVLTLFCVKIKFRNKKKERQIAENKEKENLRKTLKFLKEQNSQLQQQTLELQKVLQNEHRQIRENFKKDINEILYSQVMTDCSCETKWLKKRDFSLTLGAANYSFIVILFKILEEINPSNILEFGLGQTSKLTTQYVTYKNQTAKLDIVEHNQKWIKEFSPKLDLGENIKIHHKNLVEFELNNVKSDKYEPLDDITNNNKFDLIIIDGPFGYDRVYPRTNILDLIPGNLSDNFVIILDDAERNGEKNTAELIFNKLREFNISYKKSYKVGTKTQLIISSPNYEFINWY